MSTVYEGNIIRKTNIADVFYLIKSRYKDFNDVFNKKIKCDFVKAIYKKLDESLITNKKKKEFNIQDFTDDFHKTIFQLNKNIVYNVHICLFPYKKDVYIMNCSDYMYNGIYNDFNFEDYSYWNNTDKPDDISNREWNKRLKIWDLLCPNCPANDSLRYSPYFNEIENMAFLWKYKDLKEYFEKYNKEKRLEDYNNNYEFSKNYFKKDIINPYLAVVDNMIDITEDNFKNIFMI